MAPPPKIKAPPPPPPGSPSTTTKRISPVASHTRSASKKKKKSNEHPEEKSSSSHKKKKRTKTSPASAKKAQSVAVRSKPAKEAHTTPPLKKMKRMSKDSSDTPTKANEQQQQQSSAVVVIAKPPKPVLDVAVHRIRFLEYRPKPILCLEPTPTEGNEHVALSRDNGSIELKSPNEKWRTVASVAGMASRTVHAMAWTCGNDVSNNQNEDRVGIITERADNQEQSNSASHASSNHQSYTRMHARRTLVGASNDGTLFIVDFKHSRHAGVIASGGGAVLSLVSLCATKGGCCSGRNNNCSQLVAAGCEDGSVRIYRVIPEQKTKLELVSTIACAVGSAILSLAWRRQTNSNCGGMMAGTILYAGVADGTIRRYDCTVSSTTSTSSTPPTQSMTTNTILTTDDQLDSGNNNKNESWKSTLRMTVECLGRNTPTRVWALQALGDGTVISGDSLGHVQFWDGNTGTLLQTFDQNDNKADVLDLAVSGDECCVFASGVDSRIVCIERPSLWASEQPKDNNNRWIMTHAQRPHTHDVKALAICRSRDAASGTTFPNSKQQHDTTKEMLCSGGVDTKLCTYFVKNFRKIRPKIMYPWPSVTPIAIASESRILALRRENRIELYQLGPRTTDKATTTSSSPVLVPEEKTRLGTLEIQGAHNLVCSDISEDGTLLAVSDGLGLLLFQLSYEEHEDGTKTVVPTKVTLPSRIQQTPCVALKFAPNGRRLIGATAKGPIQVIGIANSDDMEDESNESTLDVTVVQTFQPHDDARAADVRLFPVHFLDVSHDGAWLVAARNGLESGSIQVLAMPNDNEEGMYRHWWSLPALEAPHTAVRFLRVGDHPCLAVSCTNFAFYVFDVQERQLSSWSENAGYPVTPALPTELRNRNDYPVRFGYNSATPQKLLMGSFGAFCAIDLEQPLPKHCRIFPETHVRGKRRKHHKENSDIVSKSVGPDMEQEGDEVQNNNCTICLRYNSMLYMDFLDENEMLVVEQPWLNVVASFPDALERKVYGS